MFLSTSYSPNTCWCLKRSKSFYQLQLFISWSINGHNWGMSMLFILKIVRDIDDFAICNSYLVRFLVAVKIVYIATSNQMSWVTLVIHENLIVTSGSFWLYQQDLQICCIPVFHGMDSWGPWKETKKGYTSLRCISHTECLPCGRWNLPRFLGGPRRSRGCIITLKI